MANFEPIAEWLLYQEDDRKTPGKLENIGDGAGITRLGITSKNFGNVMPSYFWQPGTDFHQVVEAAKWFYQNQEWHHINGESIAADNVAAKLLSAAVNIGVGPAVKLLQNMLGVQEDGVLGLGTLRELNAKEPNATSELFRAAWISHYYKIVDANPDDRKFLDGWINRANFPYPSPLVGNLYA